MNIFEWIMQLFQKKTTTVQQPPVATPYAPPPVYTPQVQSTVSDPIIKTVMTTPINVVPDPVSTPVESPKNEAPARYSKDHRTFRFTASNAFQRNYNWIADNIHVSVAMAYACQTNTNHGQEMKHEMDTWYHGAPYAPNGNSWPNSIGNAVITAFMEPSDYKRAQLGYASNWWPVRISAWPDGTGLTIDSAVESGITVGQKVVFPEIDTEIAATSFKGWATK